MLRDIWSVTWKELMLTRRNMKTYVTSYVIVFIIWGVLLPIRMMDDIWHGDATSAIIWFGYLSVFLASSQTITAFTGERMQKTLGTLLTTRLPDAAIYLGKVLSIMIISYTIMLMVLGFQLCALWYTAVLSGYESKFPYSSIQLTFVLVLPILSLLYTSALGVYASLKSTNIRGQHFLNLFLGVPVYVGFYYVLQSLSWSRLFSSMAVFGLVSLGITLFSIGRFNRQRLILQ